MDILKFEKMYALLVAEGIEPREFADWLRNFAQDFSCKPVVSRIKPLSEFFYIYGKLKSSSFSRDMELSGIQIAKKLVLSTRSSFGDHSAEEAESYARNHRMFLLDYDELMLVFHLLPRINTVLEACGLPMIPLSRPFWCKNGYQTELVSLCGGQTAGKTGKTGCVLLKMS